jgi:hypothetical protein
VWKLEQKAAHEEAVRQGRPPSLKAQTDVQKQIDKLRVKVGVLAGQADWPSCSPKYVEALVKHLKALACE